MFGSDNFCVSLRAPHSVLNSLNPHLPFFFIKIITRLLAIGEKRNVRSWRSRARRFTNLRSSEICRVGVPESALYIALVQHVIIQAARKARAKVRARVTRSRRNWAAHSTSFLVVDISYAAPKKRDKSFLARWAPTGCASSSLSSLSLFSRSFYSCRIVLLLLLKTLDFYAHIAEKESAEGAKLSRLRYLFEIKTADAVVSKINCISCLKLRVTSRDILCQKQMTFLHLYT